MQRGDCAGFPAPSEQGSPLSPGPLGSVLGAALSPFSPPALPTHSLSELGFPGPANWPFPPLLRPALVDWPPSLSCPSLSSSNPLPPPSLLPSLPPSVPGRCGFALGRGVKGSTRGASFDQLLTRARHPASTSRGRDSSLLLDESSWPHRHSKHIPDSLYTPLLRELRRPKNVVFDYTW